MGKMIFGDACASAAEYSLIASISMLAAVVGFQTVGITLAAITQAAAVSISLSM